MGGVTRSNTTLKATHSLPGADGAHRHEHLFSRVSAALSQWNLCRGREGQSGVHLRSRPQAFRQCLRRGFRPRDAYARTVTWRRGRNSAGTAAVPAAADVRSAHSGVGEAYYRFRGQFIRSGRRARALPDDELRLHTGVAAGDASRSAGGFSLRAQAGPL